jgi:hypothetical protein
MDPGREETRMDDRAPKKETPDDSMSRQEKERLEDQIEEFEGPDRREIRGTEEKTRKEPGVSPS